MALSNSVSAGAYIAVSECAYQFRFEKWNCPESAFNLNPIDNIATKGTMPYPPHSSIHQSAPLDPPIPQPLPRIGASKSELGRKSVMEHSDYEQKQPQDEWGKISGIHSLKASRIDAYDILTPSKILDDTEDDESIPLLSNFPQKQQLHRKINREAALVRAMTAAGITHTLTKNCSTGDFTNCVCER